MLCEHSQILYKLRQATILETDCLQDELCRGLPARAAAAVAASASESRVDRRLRSRSVGSERAGCAARGDSSLLPNGQLLPRPPIASRDDARISASCFGEGPEVHAASSTSSPFLSTATDSTSALLEIDASAAQQTSNLRHRWIFACLQLTSWLLTSLSIIPGHNLRYCL